MTHEGRMRRGKVKVSKGIEDNDTIYFLANKPQKEKPKEEVKPKEKKTKEKTDGF